MLAVIEKAINRVTSVMARLTTFALLLMILNVFYDVIMRYFFHNSAVAMQEMEWHLFTIVILFGIGVGLKSETHVRVDFLYEKFSRKSKAWINIIGALLFIIPLALLIIFGSSEFVKDSYVIKEISEDPGGLKYRWLIKAMIPASFSFLLLTAVAYIIRNIRTLREAR
ncbi:MAG: TRAP transporter small permease subunit [Thermodesulfobacteriota bacterium]